MRKDRAKFQDDFMQIVPPPTEEFFVVDRMDSSLIETKGSYILAVFIRVDDSEKIHERQIMSTGRMFEKIGGLYTSLFGAGMIWKLLFYRNIYKGEIIRKVYYTSKHESRKKKVANCDDSMTDEETQDPDVDKAKEQILN